MNPKKVEDKLAVNKFDIDREVHIRLREEACQNCEDRPCMSTCPADCFKRMPDHISFAYEGCLECGSCRTVCDQSAVLWTLPRGGYGICYEFG